MSSNISLPPKNVPKGTFQYLFLGTIFGLINRLPGSSKTSLFIFYNRIKGFVVMIHWNPAWLGSRFNVNVINIFVKAYGGNEWGSF